MTYSVQQQAPPVRYPWDRLRLAASVLGLAAGVLTVLGSFLTLFSLEVTGGPLDSTVTVNAWGVDLSGDATKFGELPISGPPVIVAAVLLLGASATCGYAALPGAAPVVRRVGGTLAVAAAAFLAGVVWTVALQVSSLIDSVGPTDGADTGDLEADAGAGIGYWALLVAVALAIAAVVLAVLPHRPPLPAPTGVAGYPTQASTPQHYRGVPAVPAPGSQDETRPVGRPPTPPGGQSGAE